MDNYRPTWAEIDLKAISNNVNSVKKLIEGKKILAVVKANAYGHGIIQVSKECEKQKVDYLGVASIDEALVIRESGINLPILVLGYTPNTCAKVAISNRIALSVFDYGLAAELDRVAKVIGTKAIAHIKIDSGMGRLGFPCDEETIRTINDISELSHLHLEGIFTHFALADSIDKTFAFEQLEDFTYLLKELSSNGIDFELIHSANSAALMDLPEAYFNMVRAGLVLYGLYPDNVDKRKLNLIPAMELKSRISSLKELDVGQTVSYGRTFKCAGKTMVAVVPIGYADGYNRLLSNKSWAYIDGYKASSLGTICMDQCMFDVTNIPKVSIGDEVILFGRPENGISADDIAHLINTISYEIVCSVGSRVPRIYKH